MVRLIVWGSFAVVLVMLVAELERHREVCSVVAGQWSEMECYRLN